MTGAMRAFRVPIDYVRRLMHALLQRLTQSKAEAGQLADRVQDDAAAASTGLSELATRIGETGREVSARLRGIESRLGELSARIAAGEDLVPEATRIDAERAMRRLDEVDRLFGQVRGLWEEANVTLARGEETARRVLEKAHEAMERQRRGLAAIECRFMDLREAIAASAKPEAEVITAPGRLSSPVAGAVLVEFQAPRGFGMPDVDAVDIVLHDGSELSATIGREATTRPGPVPAGALVRIALRAREEELDRAAYLRVLLDAAGPARPGSGSWSITPPVLELRIVLDRSQSGGTSA